MSLFSRNLPSPRSLPRAFLRAALERRVAADLPRLRAAPIPPRRHQGLTCLIYCYPPEGASLDAFEFAIRQTWHVLGHLPTILVTHRREAIPPALAALPLDIQVEPTLRPGDVASMSRDCLTRLHTRFRTPRLLVIQEDGWPVRDEIAPFLRYDYVGAPNVSPGWRARLADALSLTVLNGGFSLRSRRLLRVASVLWRLLPAPLRRHVPPEDRFLSRLRRLPFLRFPPAAVARGFSEDCLDGALPPAPDANPMGFHRPSTYAALFAPQAPLTVVSAVRDHACHARCLRDNPHLRGARFVVFDNTRDNIPIPRRYNAFIDALPPDAGWILFAHEDLEPLADPRPLLARRNPLFPLGLIGTRLVGGSLPLPFGEIDDSARDGSRPHHHHPPFPYTPLLGAYAENCDCCAIFIHADCLRATGLRFDPACAWDLYAEDFCFQFIRRTGHRIGILPLPAHHWSKGNPDTAHFRAALAHLNAKYADTLFAGGTCALLIGGLPPLRKRLLAALRRLRAR